MKRLALSSAIVLLAASAYAARGDIQKLGLGFFAPEVETSQTSSDPGVVNPEHGAIVLHNTGVGTVFKGFNGTSWVPMSGGGSGAVTAPTITTLTAGSGTYNLPAGVVYLRVRMVGGGGGGAGGGVSATASVGSAGQATTFGSSFLVANGGDGGQASSAGGAGGAASIGTGASGIAIAGGSGFGSNQITNSAAYHVGGGGASSPFGGGGGSNLGTGYSGVTNSGSGGAGGGAGGSSSNIVPGSGGGAGGYVDAIVASPSGSYTYAVGNGGSGGTAGSGGALAAAGGLGGSGVIIVEEHYQ